jgi:hypothetical protein
VLVTGPAEPWGKIKTGREGEEWMLKRPTCH